MKRDMDLAREILLQIEDSSYDGGPIEVNIEGVERSVVQYHLLLLNEAGLIDAIDATHLGSGPEYIPTRLTWLGHEFIDASRNESIWTKAKTMMMTKAGGMPFDLLMYTLKEYIKQSILE